MSSDDKLQDEPSEELEKKLKKHPDDAGLQVDVGSDESMDASDASSATQPGGSGKDVPHPSSDAPKK